MKGVVALMALLALTSLVPPAVAQNHGEIGVYADYVRLVTANNANYWGLGGRAGFNVAKHAQLEGELSYDFGKGITTGSITNGTLTLNRTNLRLLHGLFGLKVGTSGPVRVFVAAKGGFLSFDVSNNRSIVGGFTQAFSNITTNSTHGVFYPGGGIEGFLGPIGLRLDVGDLMYFNNGAQNNLRVTFGPQIRF